MPATLTLSSDTRTTAGILLLTILAVEFGGLTMLRIVRGHQPATGFQKSFARAGHAHAGVWVAAILFPVGFFGSSAGPGATRPNRLIVLLYLGAAALTTGVLTLGIGLLGS